MLAYVEPFVPKSLKYSRGGSIEVLSNTNSGLVKVKRALNCSSRCLCLGVVVKITDFWRPVDVVPNFGSLCDKDWTAETAVELA